VTSKFLSVACQHISFCHRCGAAGARRAAANVIDGHANFVLAFIRLGVPAVNRKAAAALREGSVKVATVAPLSAVPSVPLTVVPVAVSGASAMFALLLALAVLPPLRDIRLGRWAPRQRRGPCRPHPRAKPLWHRVGCGNARVRSRQALLGPQP
jgi:hypothetical protein